MEIEKVQMSDCVNHELIQRLIAHFASDNILGRCSIISRMEKKGIDMCSLQDELSSIQSQKSYRKSKHVDLETQLINTHRERSKSRNSIMRMAEQGRLGFHERNLGMLR